MLHAANDPNFQKLLVKLVDTIRVQNLKYNPSILRFPTTREVTDALIAARYYFYLNRTFEFKTN